MKQFWLASTLAALVVVAAATPAAAKVDPNNPPYECHAGGAKFANGLCKPEPTAKSIPEEVRAALYISCLETGRDEYTGQCCDHLTDGLAKRLRTCAYGAPPTVWNDIKRYFRENQDDIVKAALVIIAATG